VLRAEDVWALSSIRSKMFLADEFWQTVALGALIGWIIALLCVKVWENKVATKIEIRIKKLPQEHGEGLCWEVSRIF